MTTKRYFLVEITQISDGEVRADAAEVTISVWHAADIIGLGTGGFNWSFGTARSIPVAAANALEDVIKHG